MFTISGFTIVYGFRFDREREKTPAFFTSQRKWRIGGQRTPTASRLVASPRWNAVVTMSAVSVATDTSNTTNRQIQHGGFKSQSCQLDAETVTA